MAVSAAGERRESGATGLFGSALVASLLFSVAALQPMLFFVSVAAPFPIAVHRLSRGLGSALLASLLGASLIGWLLGSPRPALMFLTLLVAPSLLIVEAMARGRGMRRGTGWAFLLLAVQIAILLVFAGPQLQARVLDALDQFRSPAFLAQMRADFPEERVDAVVRQASLLYDAMAVVYPAAFLITGGIFVLVNAALLRIYLFRRDPGWLEAGEFEGIRFSLGLVAAFVLGGAAVALPVTRPLGYNVILIAAFFFAIQGLAVVAYFFNRLAGPPLLRAALLLLMLVNPWALQILTLLGLFDNWADFRRWADPPAAEGS